jgi:hypothetical protein
MLVQETIQKSFNCVRVTASLLYFTKDNISHHLEHADSFRTKHNMFQFQSRITAINFVQKKDLIWRVLKPFSELGLKIPAM